jgi:hypothetical protein
MTDIDNKKIGKVTIDMELKDLIDMVSRSKSSPFEGAQSQHSIEGEELRKAWFKHVLLTMEKLSDTVQEIRIKDLTDLRKDLKLEFSNDLKDLETKVDKNKDSFETYKKEVVNPIHDKLTVLLTRIGVWSIVAGFIGSGIMGLFYIFFKHYLD